jgi:hypothetical protein
MKQVDTREVSARLGISRHPSVASGFEGGDAHEARCQKGAAAQDTTQNIPRTAAAATQPSQGCRSAEMASPPAARARHGLAGGRRRAACRPPGRSGPGRGPGETCPAGAGPGRRMQVVDWNELQQSREVLLQSGSAHAGLTAGAGALPAGAGLLTSCRQATAAPTFFQRSAAPGDRHLHAATAGVAVPPASPHCTLMHGYTSSATVAVRYSLWWKAPGYRDSMASQMGRA